MGKQGWLSGHVCILGAKAADLLPGRGAQSLCLSTIRSARSSPGRPHWTTIRAARPSIRAPAFAALRPMAFRTLALARPAHTSSTWIVRVPPTPFTLLIAPLAAGGDAQAVGEMSLAVPASPTSRIGSARATYSPPASVRSWVSATPEWSNGDQHLLMVAGPLTRQVLTVTPRSAMSVKSDDPLHNLRMPWATLQTADEAVEDVQKTVSRPCSRHS